MKPKKVNKRLTYLSRHEGELKVRMERPKEEHWP